MFLKYALATALTLAPLGAADFWQAKKFTEWSEKQCRRMLEDSPWARPVSVGGDTRSGRGGGGSDMSDAKARRSGRNSGSTPPQAPAAVMAIVRWHTALPVKQAVARLRFGDAAETAPQALQTLNRREDRYVLGITNLPADALSGSQEEMKPLIRLKIKGKPDILVENIQSEKQERRANLFLFFPKGRGGAPVIELNDGEVEVEMRLPDLKIDRTFKLKDMVFGGKLEI